MSFNDTVDGWNPANQLRLVVYPVIYRVLYPPGGCWGFLNHQQYLIYFYFCAVVFWVIWRWEYILHPNQRALVNGGTGASIGTQRWSFALPVEDWVISKGNEKVGAWVLPVPQGRADQKMT